MKGKRVFLLLLQVVWLTDGCCSLRSPFSLQAAVDELHRREYPLNAPPPLQRYFAGALGSPADQDYWDEDAAYPASLPAYKQRTRRRLNKALAKYLERENYEADHGGLSPGPFGGYEFDEDNNKLLPPAPEERKRSSYFRERDNKYDNPPTSVFRERESPAINGPPERGELAEQFLREIDDAQEHERDERYREALRGLWEKYQQQENELEGDLVEERKRMRLPPYYMLMQKKRSSPSLPWLPYSTDRKKRFPVAKRSTKRALGDSVNLGKTDEKVERELSEIFGSDADDKKKRSVEEQSKQTSDATRAPDASLTPAVHEKSISNSNSNSTDAEGKATAAAEDTGERRRRADSSADYRSRSRKQRSHRKRSDRNPSHEENSEEGEDHSEEHEDEDDDEDEEEDHDEFDEDEERKKKRDVSDNEDFRRLLASSVDLTGMRRKKSLNWSKYFGFDRKKKALYDDDRTGPDDMKKRTANEEDASEEENDKRKRNLDPAKLENMNKKLQTIEDFIINETIKYTGAHEGIDNPEEIQRLKDRVLSRLATAYSLEKMRRALEKLRQSVDSENHLLRNIIEPESHSDERDESSLENQKRVAVKKEKPFESSDRGSIADSAQDPHSNSLMSTAFTLDTDREPDADDEDAKKKKKKKKRNGYLRYPDLPNDVGDLEEKGSGPGRYETLNDAYLGNKNYILGSNQCPLIESMAERCRGVDLLSGDVNQELLPLCGVHQICYLCGTSQVACDYQYLAEADTVCGSNSDCEAAARSVLMILRGTPGPQLGPKECLKNSCLYSAMREIGL